ncbi:MAG TPA: O-antigen ligase family protein [Luteitalea sp.]|nr:O-antigen ligase family protein [Luteitalea sp.]
MRALLAPAGLALLPLVFWPGLDQPFSTPKLAMMVALAVAVVVAPARPAGHPLPRVAVWSVAGAVVSVVVAAALAPLPSLAPTLLGIAAPVLALAALRHDRSGRALVAGQVVGAAACAVVAILQWVGTDPIAWSGWRPAIDGASIRMRVYGALGNPNFIGVLMAMSLPLTAAIHRLATRSAHRRAWELTMALQAAALVATGSRGAVLGLAVATTTYALLRWSRRVRLSLAALVVLAAVAVGLSPARPIDTTAAGRLYLWRIALPHVADAPLTGLGPGAVPLRFPEWQRTAARAGLRDARFAGLTDHVHNDYLEAAIERGVPGLLTMTLPMLALMLIAARARRPVDPLLAGTAAAVAAGAACGMVDFPFARPVELVWWWTAFVVATTFTPLGQNDTGT